MDDVVILDAARTAIGSFGGSLAAVTPVELARTATVAALSRAGLDADRVGQVAFGHVINTEPRDAYLSRLAALQSGMAETTPAMNVNRLCGSGLQAVVSMTQTLQLGDTDFAVAGGAESMSRSPHALPPVRFGQKMGDVKALDMMLGALTCPFGSGHMGVTAENVAERHGISRERQDAFAAESQARALAAQAAGDFDAEIAGVTIKTRKGDVVFDRDEHPKASDAESLAKLRPAFAKEGSVTAGNASGINDGAAAVVLARAEAAKKAGLTPKARILGYAIAGVAPDVMGLGPIPAVQKLCDRYGLKVEDFDWIESNEAFAAQALAVNDALGLDPNKVNPAGGAIALGHPVGATGAILMTKALYGLIRTGGTRALVTMCIGGGQGIAMAFERL